ncbi:HK97 family phage prohead protease [Corynebacterium sp. FDAARGOS 1242]|uniref:HK97 family phage prohead protease n=1 Tax=Corynebacterium sp. FDAARGOS 1242 TaxID=2778078 RepID=UPI00194DE7DE|nr:HK97 family phage prohead protease [Corynebacterium sp. FDAARGOS 1242]QRP98954.1 HK97 family phage prohead protease [Corynebacterium sp. FDAARGOS 1242]
MTIHVVMGPPCSGKSTFVKKKAGVGNPRFDVDEVYSCMAGQELHHEKPPAITDVVSAMRRGLYGWLLDPETRPVGDVWLIHGNPPASTIAGFKAVGAEFHLIDPGLEVCLARCEEEDRPEGTEERIRGWYDNPPVIPDDEKEGEAVHKDFTVDLKATPPGDSADEAPEGYISAYAAVFNNVDSYGDVIRRGAFEETLKEWEESGNNIPLLYGHDFADPFSNIGVVTSAVEDDHGLKIEAVLDLDNEKAAQVHRLIKERRLSQMSFAFRVLDAAESIVDDEHVFELKRLKLYEVSVVPIGANEQTEILSVKNASEMLSTAVKQAGKLSEAERAHLARACKTAVDELNGAPGVDETAEKEETNRARARARAVKAHLMLMEACYEDDC